MVKFVHTSDWQIGMKGGGLGAAAGLVARERLRTIDRVLAVAEEQGADFVVACGDLFEHNQVSQELVEDIARAIAGRRNVQVHAIPGNHDLPGAGSVWNRSALRAVSNLHVHLDPTPVLLGAVTIHPFPVRSRYAASDPLAALPELRATPGVHIALAHGHLTTVTFGAHEENIRLPLDPAHVDRTGLDFLALGHWHGTRMFPAGDGATRIAYAGTHEQTSFRETDAGNVLLVEIAGKGAPPVVTPVRVGTLAWARIPFAFAADVDLARLHAALDACTADLLELELSGEVPVSLYGEFRELVAAAEGRFKHLSAGDTDVRWRAAEVPETDPIADAALAEVDRRLIAATAAGPDADVAREARAFFRRLVREAAP